MPLSVLGCGVVGGGERARFGPRAPLKRRQRCPSLFFFDVSYLMTLFNIFKVFFYLYKDVILIFAQFDFIALKFI